SGNRRRRANCETNGHVVRRRRPYGGPERRRYGWCEPLAAFDGYSGSPDRRDKGRQEDRRGTGGRHQQFGGPGNGHGSRQSARVSATDTRAYPRLPVAAPSAVNNDSRSINVGAAESPES